MNKVVRATPNILGDGMRGGPHTRTKGTEAPGSDNDPVVGSGPDICTQSLCLLRIHTHTLPHRPFQPRGCHFLKCHHGRLVTRGTWLIPILIHWAPPHPEGSPHLGSCSECSVLWPPCFSSPQGLYSSSSLIPGGQDSPKSPASLWNCPDAPHFAPLCLGTPTSQIR